MRLYRVDTDNAPLLQDEMLWNNSPLFGPLINEYTGSGTGCAAGTDGHCMFSAADGSSSSAELGVADSQNPINEYSIPNWESVAGGCRLPNCFSSCADVGLSACNECRDCTATSGW